MARPGGIEPGHVAAWRPTRESSEVGRARAAIREHLHDWALPKLVDSTEPMVGELVTNAVRHSHARPVALRLVRGDTLLCEVEDDGHEPPTLPDARPPDDPGADCAWSAPSPASGGRTGRRVRFEPTLPRR
jgi:anti-sigma regulatory factor (Ser/Thr protein kinase)